MIPVCDVHPIKSRSKFCTDVVRDLSIEIGVIISPPIRVLSGPLKKNAHEDKRYQNDEKNVQISSLTCQNPPPRGEFNPTQSGAHVLKRPVSRITLSHLDYFEHFDFITGDHSTKIHTPGQLQSIVIFTVPDHPEFTLFVLPVE